jgi:CTP:molybdopterin cytidylyltransferase MocA
MDTTTQPSSFLKWGERVRTNEGGLPVSSKKIGIVLLAAGSSSRYQGIKLLDTIEGKKMYLHIMEKLQSLPLSPKIIVTQYDEISSTAPEYGYVPIMNMETQLGISHSIQTGLKQALMLEPKLEAVMFGVCDQPFVTSASLGKLMEAFQNTDQNLVVLTYQDRMGNPCIFGKKYFPELFALSGDVGGKVIIRNHSEDVLPVDVSQERELIDIDIRI